MVVVVVRRTQQVVVLLLVVAVLCSAALPKKRKKSSFSGPTKGGASSIPSVVEKTLAKETVSYRSIIAENAAITAKDKSVKRFTGDTLGYVTPWGASGYDEAKKFAAKFTYVAPVWYQVSADMEESSMLRGGHDVDQQWIGDVRQSGKGVKITPRFLWDQWTARDYSRMLSDQMKMDTIAAAMGKEVVAQGYDGVVLDFGYLNSQSVRSQFSYLLSAISSHVRGNNGEVILVVPPYIEGEGAQLFSSEEFTLFSKFVDKFQIMSYDYASPTGEPAANAPLSWMTQTVLNILPPSKRTPENANKLMLGLNFYGKDYSYGSMQTVLGHDYLQLLDKYQPDLKWLDSEGEHQIRYRKAGTEHLLYYPSLLSIQKRIELAEQLGVGLAVWELSQGLPYFLALF